MIEYNVEIWTNFSQINNTHVREKVYIYFLHFMTSLWVWININYESLKIGSSLSFLDIFFQFLSILTSDFDSTTY